MSVSTSSRFLHDTRHWLALVSILLLLGIGWTVVSRVPASFASLGQIPSPREGFPAPNFTLQTPDGHSLVLSSYRGKVVIVNFWASWCGPCRAEMPVINQVYQTVHAQGLMVLAIDTTFQNNEADARAFAAQLGLSFPILLDREGSVSRAYLLRALPTTYIIDRHGIIRTVVLGGPMNEAFLRSQVEPLLQEAP
jgi:cytochrome c biogenesis protein CcmG, thiol:disulfide interchange protein DsbE